MPRIRTESAKAAGKLIKEIQRVWNYNIEYGQPNASLSEDILDLAHDLLQARDAPGIKRLLGKRTVKQYLGSLWVESHPAVKARVEQLEQAIASESA
ncbi:hypothetical protein ACVW0Y_003124 [Pseudomonas sp. TE3786]